MILLSELDEYRYVQTGCSPKKDIVNTYCLSSMRAVMARGIPAWQAWASFTQFQVLRRSICLSVYYNSLGDIVYLSDARGQLSLVVNIHSRYVTFLSAVSYTALATLNLAQS